jgi:hypothetical protein
MVPISSNYEALVNLEKLAKDQQLAMTLKTVQLKRLCPSFTDPHNFDILMK